MEKNLFSREDTRLVKAAAALMMMAHHLFAFPNRLPTDFAYDAIFPENSLMIFGQFCRFCISLFFFLGGYGLCKQHEAGRASLPRILLNQYRQYWKVFFLFVPIGLIFFRNQPTYCEDVAICAAYAQPTLKVILSNLIAWSSELNREWWFLKNYLIILFVGLACLGLKPRRLGFCPEALIVIVATIINRSLLNSPPDGSLLAHLKGNQLYVHFVLLAQYTDPFPFFMGVVFARYDGVHRLREMLQSYARPVRLAIGAAGLIILYVFWTGFIWDQADILLAPLFVVCWLEVVDNLPFGVGRKVFGLIGRESANIWLIHSFFCYYFYPAVRLVYRSTNPILVFLTLTALTLTASLLVTHFYKGMGLLFRKLKAIPGKH